MRSLRPAIVLLVLGLSAAAARAQPRDPELEWRTLDTPHFQIEYHVPLGRLARRVAVLAERAHAVLAEVMGYTANRRTYIVLSDETDSANGSATALPFNTIRLFATAPEALSPLSDYDDWMNLLVVHEHTHIVHLDQWSGAAAFVNLLLGKLYAPNHVQPRWFLEGVATWQESERTSAGRLRSSIFDMYMRMDALEGRFFDLDQVSTIADRWPHGNVWYLYGSQFVDYIARQHGRESIARMSVDYGGSLIPWGINRTAQRATGRSFVELYDDFLSERREQYRAQRDAVVAAGLVEGERITFHGEMARLPRFTRDGQVYYLRDDNRTRARVVSFDLARPTAQRTWTRTTAPGASMHPDGHTLYFTRSDAYRDIYFYNDLFRADVRTGAIERLTHGMRAREPDVSPNGRDVVFVVNRSGTTHLMIADARDVTGTARMLLESEPYEQVFNPRFSPDGRSIAFSRWRHGGYRDIQVLDVASRALTEVTHDRAQDMGPCWSADGRKLYFSSNRTGIDNIYAYEPATGALSQVTNVVSGAFQPAVSPDGRHLVYLGYTSFGFDLFYLDLTRHPSRPAPAFTDTRPAAEERAWATDQPLRPGALWNGPSRGYDPIPTLLPRSYLLDIGNDGFGAALGITLEGSDLAGWHAYSLRATTGLVRWNVNTDLGYEYRRSPLSAGLRLFRRVSPRGGFFAAGEDRSFAEHAIGAEGRLSYRLPESFQSQAVALTYSVSYSEADEPLVAPIDPNDPPPRLPFLGWSTQLRLSWSYSNLERYGYDISASNGEAVSFGIAVSDPLIGSGFRAVSFTWDLRQYLPLPWLQSHVIGFHFAGGISGGDPGRRAVFGLGGFPEVAPLSGLLQPQVLGGTALRGYPANDRVGTQYHLLQVEYRFPIVRLNRGVYTIPVYLNRLYAVAFADAGDAFVGELDLSRVRVGVGGELLLDFTLGYFLPFTVRVGYARGLMQGGIDQFYGHLGVPF